MSIESAIIALIHDEGRATAQKHLEVMQRVLEELASVGSVEERGHALTLLATVNEILAIMAFTNPI